MGAAVRASPAEAWGPQPPYGPGGDAPGPGGYPAGPGGYPSGPGGYPPPRRRSGGRAALIVIGAIVSVCPLAGIIGTAVSSGGDDDPALVSCPPGPSAAPKASSPKAKEAPGLNTPVRDGKF